ncbi:MAG: GxxExxY protein [Ferruginibacter sp.]
MVAILFREESYKIIGLCMEVHRQLGHGFKEIVYKDALEHEFRVHDIPFIREQKYTIIYKDIILPHGYTADFIVYDSIVFEIKARPVIVSGFVIQTVNYLKASGLKLGIIANFGKPSFESQRVVF